MSSSTLRSILAAFDPELPLERAKTIPNTWYTSPEVYDTEKAAVFARTWQMVGRSAEVASPGQYLTAEVAGDPIVVVRAEDGILRAFFNVCRHRAAPIVNEPCGTATKLRCRYHGWTYNLSGRLIGLPEFDGVEDFCKDDNGLPPVSVGEWGGMIWVHLDAPREPLSEFLRPIATWSEQVGGAGLEWFARKSYELRCNWKVYVDNYLDGEYHVNYVHPALADVIDYRDYRTVCDGNTVVQTSPLKAAEGVAGRTRTGDAAYWWVYPNFMLNATAGVMDTNLVQPLGPDRCRVVFDFYFAPGTDEAFKRDSVAMGEQVQDEDVRICEEVQTGLNSRSYSTGRFSVKRENGGHYFHQLLGRALQRHIV